MPLEVALLKDLKANRIVSLKIDQPLTTTEIKDLAEALAFCTDLQSFILNNNHFTAEDIKILVEGLKVCTHLKTLDLSNNKINFEGFTIITQLFLTGDIRNFDISNNKLGTDGGNIKATCQDLSDYHYNQPDDFIDDDGIKYNLSVNLIGNKDMPYTQSCSDHEHD